MEGWQVVTTSGDKVGKVAAVVDGYLLVEHGHVHKTRLPVPRSFAHPREEDEIVCLSLPKDLVVEAPKADKDGSFDEQLVAEHYGLVGPSGDAPTVGAGEALPDDPRYGPDRNDPQAIHAERLRASTRTHKRRERFPSSPSFLGERKRNNARGS